MRMGIMGYNQGKSPSTAPYRVVRLRQTNIYTTCAFESTYVHIHCVARNVLTYLRTCTIITYEKVFKNFPTPAQEILCNICCNFLKIGVVCFIYVYRYVIHVK